MAYTPPTPPVNVSWIGEPAYSPAQARAMGWWGSTAGVVFQPVWRVSTAIGAPTVRENKRLQALGMAPPAFHQPVVYPEGAYIPPAWNTADATWFGESSYTPALGIDAATWYDNPATLISPQGITPTLEFGEPQLRQPSFLRPTGFDSYRSGRVGARFWWEYLPDNARNINASWVGAGSYTPPVWNAVPGHWTVQAADVGLAGLGWLSQAFGAPGIGLFRRTVRPSPAWGGAQLGKHLAKNVADSLRPPGWASQAHGQPRIYNRNQWVQAAGNIKSGLAFGLANVYNRTRYIRPLDDKGNNNHMRVGEPTGSHGIRRVLPPQIAKPPFGTAWISHSPRRLVHTGWDSMRMTVHTVAPTRFIRVVGTEMTRWLTRIIPEDQRATPLGLRATEWGQHLVRTQWQIVRVQGFPLAFQGQEANRYGKAYAYNLRQYITQTFNPEAGNAGERFGPRAEVHNRNKTLATFGQPMQRFGSHFVDNKARRLDPRPIAPPAVGLQFISHGVRRLFPDAVVAQTSGEWSVVFNGARPIKPPGLSTGYVPQPELVANTRRYYRSVTLGETLALGVPFIAPAIREIKFSFTQLIHPPQIEMPYVGLYTRYIEPKGTAVIDGTGTGYPTLEIKWNKMYPKWVLKDAIGTAVVRNLTPEYHTFGHNSAEWGQALIRNEYEYKQMQGFAATQWGGHRIMDKLQRLWPRPVDPQVIPRSHLVKKLMDDPPSTQYVLVDRFPGNQVGSPGSPKVIGNVLYHQSDKPSSGGVGDMTLWGKDTALFNNAIKVESGIFDRYFGEPFVSLKNRQITVGPFDDEFVFEPPPQDVWPRTIWAVSEPPSYQAVQNHPQGPNGNLVNDHGSVAWKNGAMCGRPSIRGRRDTIQPTWYGAPNGLTSYGSPLVMNRRQYVYGIGSKVHRIGAPRFFGGQESLVQFEASDTGVVGAHEIRHLVADGLPQTVPLKGFIATGWTLPMGTPTRVELFSREVKPTGAKPGEMGRSLSTDKHPYMRQSLWVGPPDWSVIGAGELTLWGNTWISYRNREVKVPGTEFGEWGPDIDHFRDRMKVIRTPAPPPPVRQIEATGFDAFGIRVPDVLPLRRFIRPDGNSFTFRQGVGDV